MSTGLVAKAKAESVGTSTQGYRSAEHYSFVFACLVVLAITIAAVRWILDHPYGIHWDEALYFDNVLRDIHNLYSGSLRQLGSILIGGDVRRPPANLLVALPFLIIFGFHTAVARFVTLACWGVSAWFIYLTTRRIASPAAGALAAVVFCLSPEVISASIFFSTEGPFFLATSIMLYFVSSYWTDGREPSDSNWIGLGFALGLLIGRVVVSRILIKVAAPTVTLGAAILMSITTYGMLQTNDPTVAAIMVFCAGVAMAPVFPTTLAMVGDAFPRMTATAMGIAITSGWIGLAVSSRIIGAIAGTDTTRIKTALLVLPAFSLLMILVNLAVRPMLKKHASVPV